MFSWLADYLKRLANSADRTATIHDAAYGVGVLFFIFWLNHGLYKGKGFTDGWNNTAMIFAGLIGAGAVTGTIVNRPRKEGE